MIPTDLTDDPVLFARGILGVHTWPFYEHMLRRQAVPNIWLMMVGCHNGAKTHAASVGDLYHVAHYEEDGRVVCLAPGFTQIDDVIWAETRSILANAPGLAEIDDELVQVADGIPFFPDALHTELQIPGQPKRGILSITSDKPQRLRGLKGGHLRVRVEEMDGIKPEHWDEAEQGMTAGGFPTVVAAINPTLPSGPAFDACKPGSGWDVLKVHAFLTPNLSNLLPDTADPMAPTASEIEAAVEALLAMPEDEGGPLDEVVFPHTISRRYVRRTHDRYGAGHPFWIARVMADFPEDAEAALVAIKWLEGARDRPAVDHHAIVTGGLDIAGPGKDATAAVIAEEWIDPETKAIQVHLLDRAAWPKGDCRGDAVRFFNVWKDRLRTINGDDGGPGHHFLSHLEDAKLPVTRVRFASTDHSDPQNYALLRDQLMWNVRERLERGEVHGLTDEVTAAQAAGIKWDTDTKGRIIVGRVRGEGNRIISQKRGGKSPDRIEAVALALWHGKRHDVFSGELYQAERPRPTSMIERRGVSGLRGVDW